MVSTFPFLMLISILVPALVVFIVILGFLMFLTTYKSKVVETPDSVQEEEVEYVNEFDPEGFNCQVQLQQSEEGDSSGIFSVEICGVIEAESDNEHAIARVSISDITDGAGQAQPIRNSVAKPQKGDIEEFCFVGELGKLPDKVTTVSDWMNVAQIEIDLLSFPRKEEILQ